MPPRGRSLRTTFGVDVAYGDPILGEPDVVLGDDLLSFAGIAPPTLRLYPVETHIAEKLHAYTLPRPTGNTRVKDLPDLALLAQIGSRDARRVCAAFEQTFSFRKTHLVPPTLPDPPPAWAASYAAMAEADSLPWATLESVTGAARLRDPLIPEGGVVRIPKSLGAAAKDIPVRGGGRLVSDITNVEGIAEGRGIREVGRLVGEYGGRAASWRKLKGIADVELPGGGIGKAEVHWYQAHGVGKVEFKVKTWLD